MPTYEYKCAACDHVFERFQKISDRPVRTCPQCGKRRVRRLISSGGGIVFKGPGFYATDYRKDTRGSEGEATSKSESKSRESSAKPSESSAKPSDGGEKKGGGGDE